MPNLYMMCGLPRSGKSTWVELNREGKVVVSADSIRMMIHGQPFLKQYEKLIWDIFNNMLTKCLDRDIDIIVDNTNLNLYMRTDIINKAKLFDYKIIAVYIPTPEAVCIERAAINKQFDLISVIQHMNLTGTPPSLNEGIDEIIEIVNYS